MSTPSFPNSVVNFGADRVNGESIPPGDANAPRAEIIAIETALLTGYMPMTETWTYASASQFRVPGDRTAFYTKGKRLKWTQTTVKYGIVASSSYSAPDTTITILVNTDYTLANAAISAQAVSNLDNPPGWPDWFNYTPTWSCSGSMTYTGITTQQAMYRVTGRTVAFVVRGTGTTGGTAHTEIRATAPVTPVVLTANNVPLACNISDNGYIAGRAYLDTSTGLIAHTRADGAVWTLGATRVCGSEGFYPW